MTTDLTTTGNTQLGPVSGFAVEGGEDMGPGDIIVPAFSIIQPTSKGEKGQGKMGYFYETLTQSTTDVLIAVLLKISPCRSRWEKGNNVPLCSSNNGRQSLDGNACTNCTYNFWPKTEEDKNIACKSGYLLLCANQQDDDSVFLFRAMGASATPAKVLYNIFLKKNIPLFSALLKFETTYKDEPNKHYVFQPSIIDWFTPEKVAHYRELFLFLQGVNISEQPEPAGTADAAESSEIPFN